MLEKSNKEFAASFLKLAAAGKVDEAYQKYVADDFKHHNQFFKGDRLSLLNAMKGAHEKMPNTKFEIKSIVEENDKIVTHSLVVKANMQIVAFHMMRFRHGKIVEFWDLGAPVPKNAQTKTDCSSEVPFVWEPTPIRLSSKRYSSHIKERDFTNAFAFSK